jgi:hypothetical protein
LNNANAVSFDVWTVYDLIDVIRRKPGLFIDEPSVTGLWHFIHGFRSALHAAGRPLDPEHPPFRGFNDWIASRYGFSSSLGWKNMLLRSVGDDESAFERVLTELDAYRENGAANEK